MSKTLRIPRIIHYCWFGGKPLPDDAKKYIESWKKYCPEFKIKEWNEDNFDINCCPYVKEAYEAKKWAFITDYVRLKVIYDYGGIYMDTDVEVLKPLDELLKWNAFSGFESSKDIPTGTMGAVANNEWIGYLLSYYDNRHFILPDGSFDLTTNVVTITRMTKEKYNLKLNNKFQVFGDNMAIYPFSYLCAKRYDNGTLHISDETFTVHHFSGSWISGFQKFKLRIRKTLNIILGVTITNKIINIYKKISNSFTES